MKKIISSFLVMIFCFVGGYLYYTEQQKVLDLEWKLASVELQRDLVILEFNRCKSK